MTAVEIYEAQEMINARKAIKYIGKEFENVDGQELNSGNRIKSNAVKKADMSEDVINFLNHITEDFGIRYVGDYPDI